MAKRICFLFGAMPSEYQAVSKFIESFRQFNLASQAEIAIVFNSEKDQSEFFRDLQSIPKSDSTVKLDESGEFFSFDSPKKSQDQFQDQFQIQSQNQLQNRSLQDEIDDDDARSIFFFLEDKPKKSPKQKKSDALNFADDELQKAAGDSFFFFPSTEASPPKSNPVQTADKNLRMTPIVMPKKYQAGINGAGTFRARVFYGLNQLKDQFDYILACELPCAIVRNVNLHKIFDDFFARKILWGNEISGTNRASEWIRTSCAKWFANTLNWQKVLSPMYLWFNQPFIYRTADLDEFFEVTGILDNLTAIAWTDFHYYIYMYYLMLYRDFKIRDIGIKSNIGVCESNSLGSVKGRDPEFKPMICRKPIQRHLDNENLFIVFGA